VKRLSSLLVAGLAAVALVPVTALSGTAATKLSTGPVQALVVDQAHGKVFVSGNKSVAVTNLSGALLGTIAGITAPRGATLSADGSGLLVLDGHAVQVVDPATSTVVSTVPLGDNVCPVHLAPASGKVFFTYYACDSGTVQADQLGAVDLDSGVVTTGLLASSSGYWRRLAVIPGQPDALAGLADRSLTLIDTTGGTVPSATNRTTVLTNGYFPDVAVAPDGSRLVVGRSEAGFHGFKAYSTADLTELHSYPLTSQYDPEPGSVAFRPDGTLAVAWQDNLNQYYYLRYYKPGAGTPFFEKRFGVELFGTIAFGSTYLYGTYTTSSSTGRYLEVYVAGPPAKLTLTSTHTTYPWLSDVTLVATLSSPTKSRKVTIFAKPAGGSERWLKTGYVNSSGQLKVALHDLKVNTTVRAVFKTDGLYDSNSVSRTIKIADKVILSSSSTSMSGSYHRLPASPTPTLRVKVYTGSATACVQITGFQHFSTGWHRFDYECIPTPYSKTFNLEIRGFKRGDRLKVTAKSLGEWNASSPTVTYYLLLT